MNNTLTIGVHGLRVYARVGVYEEERILKNLLSIDVEVIAGKNTHEYEGRRTINYFTLVEIINEACGHEVKLLEGLADKIIDNIKELHDGISSIHLRIHKVHPVMELTAQDVFVEVKYVG